MFKFHLVFTGGDTRDRSPKLVSSSVLKLLKEIYLLKKCVCQDINVIHYPLVMQLTGLKTIFFAIELGKIVKLMSSLYFLYSNGLFIRKDVKIKHS